MTGYCTTEDVRRVLQDTEFDSVLSEDSKQIVVDAIEAQSQWLEKATNNHWFVSGGIGEDTEGVVDTGPLTRDDEHDIPRRGALVHGASERERYRYNRNSDALLEAGPRHDRRRWTEHRREPKREIRLATGDLHDETIPTYTRIRLDRKNVSAVNELSVVNAQGGYDDWVSDADYDGGVGNSFRGDDYWVRINNDGVAELYLDVHAMDDDIATLSNAVYVDIDFGIDDLPQSVRQAVAKLAAAWLVHDDEFRTSLPDSGQLVGVETKAQAWEREARRGLRPHITEEWALEELGAQ
jgi:hypothetical protein